MKALPLLSWIIIQGRAGKLQVRRDLDKHGNNKVNAYPASVSYADLETAVQFAENEKDKDYMCAKVNELSLHTINGKISTHWPLPVDVPGFSNYISNREYTPMQAV